MAGTAGATIGIAEVQPVIGAYVQDATEPSANTNFSGMNTATSYKTNVLGEAIGFEAPCNVGAATGDVAQWVQAGAAIVVGDGLALAAGVASVDNSTGTHTAFAAAEADDYLWAVEGFTP